MTEDNNMTRKTWARVLEPVSKMGYMNGASDGQTAVFQPSFDTGYEQGLSFGLMLGFNEALLRKQQSDVPESTLQGTNCQICLNGVLAQENIGNLYNIQKEKNSEYLLKQ